MTSILNAGVMGAGVFGRYHASKYAENPKTALKAIYDVHLGCAQELAAEFNVEGFDHIPSFLAAVEVVTVASPAETHFENASRAIAAGKSILVEKPLATDVNEAKSLIAAAARKNVVLAVGHQERLVFEAIGLYGLPEKPTRIVAVRQGTWSGRGADVSVTLDLMVHDADLVMSIFDEPKVGTVTARAKSKQTDFPDEISAEIRFQSGRTAKLSASRIAKEQLRWMTLTYQSGIVHVDFVKRTFENTTEYDLNAAFAETPQAQDPLAANVERFVDAVLKLNDGPAVTGPAGLRALALALKADEVATKILSR